MEDRAFYLFCQVVAQRGAVPTAEVARELAKQATHAVAAFDDGCAELRSEKKKEKKTS